MAAFVLFVIGALLIGYSLFANLTRPETTEFHFKMTIDKLGITYEAEAAGTRKVYGKQFYFEGERISFLGEIEDQHVTLKGTVKSGADDGKTRDFTAEGMIAENRMATSVFTEKGSKIGKIEMQF